MSDGLLRCVGGCLAALDFLENLIKLLKNGLRQKFFVLPYCFLETQPYKNVLKKNKVRVISATENISEGSEGILLESLLEGMAEY